MKATKYLEEQIKKHNLIDDNEQFYNIEITINIPYPAVKNFEDTHFYFEEHLCVQNVLDLIENLRNKVAKEKPNECFMCSVSKIELIEESEQ